MQNISLLYTNKLSLSHFTTLVWYRTVASDGLSLSLSLSYASPPILFILMSLPCSSRLTTAQMQNPRGSSAGGRARERVEHDAVLGVG